MMKNLIDISKIKSEKDEQGLISYLKYQIQLMQKNEKNQLSIVFKIKLILQLIMKLNLKQKETKNTFLIFLILNSFT